MATPPPGFVGPSKRKLPGVFINLTTLLVFVVALGLTQASIYLVAWLIDSIKAIVGRIPRIGPWAERKLEKLNTYVRNRLGTAARKCEHKVAAAFRDLASGITEMVAELFAIAVAIAALTWFVTVKLSPVLQAIPLIKRQLKRIRVVERVTKVVNRTIRVTQVVQKTVVRTVIRNGKVVIHTTRQTLPRWVRQLRRRVTQLERGHARQAKRLTALERRFTARRMDGLVLRSLQRLGLGWTRCTSVGKVGRALCRNGTGWLDDLLLGALPLLFLADICTLARAMEGAAGLAEPALRAMIDVAEEPLACYDLESAPPLPLNTTALPQASGALALV